MKIFGLSILGAVIGGLVEILSIWTVAHLSPDSGWGLGILGIYFFPAAVLAGAAVGFSYGVRNEKIKKVTNPRGDMIGVNIFGLFFGIFLGIILCLGLIFGAHIYNLSGDFW